MLVCLVARANLMKFWKILSVFDSPVIKEGYRLLSSRTSLQDCSTIFDRILLHHQRIKSTKIHLRMSYHSHRSGQNVIKRYFCKAFSSIIDERGNINLILMILVKKLQGIF